MSKLLWVSFLMSLGSFVLAVGCSEIPYTGPVLTVDDVDRYLALTGEDTVCLQDGFDTVCIKTIQGKDGKQGPPGRDGMSYVLIREVPIEVIVEKIVETVVIEKEIVEVPIVVEKVVERIEYIEVPITQFVTETVEVIKEVIREVEVPLEIREVIREVPVETIVEKIVYITEEPEAPIVREGATYTESGYHNPPAGTHTHEFTHTHDGAMHTHRIVHPDGEQDDWDREHNGWEGLPHD